MTDHRVLDPQVPVHPVPTPTRWVFTELVCADPGLLRVEFNALIAVNFPPAEGRRDRRPPRRPGPPGIDWFRLIPPPGPPGVGPGGVVVWIRPVPGPDRPARERSPPRLRPNHTENPHVPGPRPHEGGEGINR